ncbi:hypothetical protein B9T19_02740 [Ignatzschineria sp. F8392]|uniref:hypothetical protein n=1 Tax=Ignatzschineria sp. F8392 TaxID=1980117 RepID=UPI000B98EC6E|nr:hypothetical protein [Ignatzschineria sp. F8392]OYQ81602.1 hypothetical protein B9T19_02740 [Ignatzschineria sp. F8392]
MKIEKIEKIEGIEREINKKISYLLTPSIETIDHAFMPLSDHPSIYGISIPKSFKEYFYSDITSLKLDMYLSNIEKTSFVVSFAEYIFEINYNSDKNKLNFYYNGIKIAHLPLSNRFMIVLRVIDNKLYLTINGRRLKELKEDISVIKQSGLVINNLETDIYLVEIQAMYADKGYHYKYFGFHNERATKELYKTAPKYVLEWERRTKEFYTTLLSCYQLLKFHDHLSDETIQLVYKYSEFVFETLFAWPKWRPSSNTDVGNAIWETNNWSNGYAAGAFSLSCSILNINNARVNRKFFDHGTSWLLDKRGLGTVGITQAFPNTIHWNNRSTNHGIVILTTFLLGALLLHKRWTTSTKVLYKDLQEIVNSSLQDGSYLESISYFQFIVLELSPFLFLLAEMENMDINALIDRDFPAFKKCCNFIKYSSNPVTKKYFANYGDCESTEEWLFPVSCFFQNISPNLLFRDLEYKQELYSIFTLNYDDNVNNKNYDCNSVDFCFFKDNSFFSLHNNEDGFYLWVNGSKLHKTHNKDNDIGAFYLSDTLGKIFVKKQGRLVTNHNVFVVDSIYLNEDPVSVIKKIPEYTSARKINGVLSIVYEGSESICLRVNIKNHLTYDNRKILSEYSRYFYISKTKDFYMLISDYFESEYNIGVKSLIHLYDGIVPNSINNHKIAHERFVVECDKNSIINYCHEQQLLEIKAAGFCKKGWIHTCINNTQDIDFKHVIEEFYNKVLEK